MVWMLAVMDCGVLLIDRFGDDIEKNTSFRLHGRDPPVCAAEEHWEEGRSAFVVAAKSQPIPSPATLGIEVPLHSWHISPSRKVVFKSR